MARYKSTLILLWICFGVVAGNFAPLFFNLPARLNIPEDQSVGSLLFTMFGFDFDSVATPKGRIHYLLTPIDHTDFKFSVDAAMGDMYLVQSLDYETKESYELIAEVADLGTPPKSQRKKIFVNVVDVNDNAPICRAPNVIGSLSEDALEGSTIASLDCTDPDTGAGGYIDYEIIGGDTDVIEVSRSGEATLKRQVDYDTEKDTYEVDIKVKDRGTPQLFSTAKIILSLADIDDNEPVFSQPGGYTANISENSPLGTTVLVLIATDADAPNTDASLVHYGLEANPTPDWVNVDPFSGSIIVKGNIDWELNTLIECDVYAFSSDRFQNRSIVHVTITVDDVNDGIPTFDQAYYEITINESTTANITVATINAVDLDDGPDGEVTYSIEGDSVFRINDTTGVISLHDSADYEDKKSYLVTVVAQDGGNPATSSSVFVQVSILPENEFSPVFVSPYTFDVSEDLAPGSSVFTISTTDGDEGLDGLIGYRVVTDGLPFLVDAGTGVVRVAYNLDFETITSYNITVEAMDNSTTSRRSAQQTFLINILDANDVAAVCDPIPTQVLRHPFAIGVPILTLVCTDVDTDASGLSYNISMGNDATFEIENDGDFMMTAPPLKSRYDLTLEVDDGGGQITSVSFTLFTETTLTFQNLPQVIFVNESSSSVTAAYMTRPGYAFPPVWSRFISGNEEHRLILGPGSGSIVFALDFDRDVQENYNYTLEATSGSGQNITQDFTLRVLDLNDNSPTFSNTAFEFKLSENLPVGSDIYLLLATDADSGINAEVNYSISVGNQDETFAINLTGWLSLASNLHFEKQAMHILEIEAADSGNPSLTGTTTVVVTVVDEKEDDPEIVSVDGQNEVEISEDAVLGSVVFQLTLPLSNIPDAVTFSILSGNEDGYFGLASTSGKIYLAKMLDRESLSFFSFSLEMAAVNQNGSTVRGAMNVTVGDVNDNHPIFSKAVYLMDVQHGQVAGSRVGEVLVSDADDGENGNVTLAIIGGNTGSALEFSGTNLLTTVEMDYNSVKSYSLLVEAIDHGVPAMSSHCVVYVRVIPITFIPRFASPNKTVIVEESTRVGSHITDVDATALGASELDGSLKYEIQSGNSLNHFSIDEDSGLLTLVKSLNFEEEISFHLKIVAIYLLDTSQRDEVILTIEVANVNEFTPTFDEPSYHWSVSESEQLSYAVGNITVIDDDGGTFGEFVTTLTGGNGDFQLTFDGNTGTVAVTQPLDYIRQNLYTLTVVAIDQGIPPKSSAASITIEIVDENDHSPSFTQVNYTTQIYSLIPLGSEVFHMHATDLDSGDYGNVTYAIISDSSAGKFLLNSVTGILTTADQCDVTSYVLEIRAEDGASPPQTGTAGLEITVLPGYGENSAPLFTSGSVVDLTVSRKVSPRHLVSTLQATDVDANNLTYYIVSGNEDGFFLVDQENGELSTATWLTTASNQYSLVISVHDNGKPRGSSSITANIDINPPRTDAINADYSFSVSEDVGSGHLVGRILVDSGRIVSDYIVVSGNHGNAFEIETDAPSGEGLLKTANDLDYEEFSLFSLQIQVTTDLRNLTKVVEVSVTDVNDEAPYFESPSLSLSLAEHTPVGHTLTTIAYQDDDFSESNRMVTFSITNAAATNFLSIDQSGHLTLLISPDYETTQQFSATVTVTQAAFTPAATLDITVHVLDLGETQRVETPPQDRAIFISLELPHLVDEGFVVHTLTLANFGIDSATSHEFVSFDVAPPFTVDHSTGEITVTNPDAIEAGQSYFRWVVCRTPSRSVMSLVRLDAFDKDGNIVVIEFGDTYANVHAKKQAFLNRAQAFFDGTQRVGLSFVFGGDASLPAARRKLLSSSTTAGLYVVSDDSVDGMGEVGTSKGFLSQAQVLENLQESDSGAPVSGLSEASVLTVVSVVGYVPSSTEDDESFIASPEGIAMLTLLALMLVGGGVALYWVGRKKCCANSKNIMEDPHRRRKQTTTTTIGGSTTNSFEDTQRQSFRRRGTIVVEEGATTESLNNNATNHTAEENPQNPIKPLVVKPNTNLESHENQTLPQNQVLQQDQYQTQDADQIKNESYCKDAPTNGNTINSELVVGTENPGFSHEEDGSSSNWKRTTFSREVSSSQLPPEPAGNLKDKEPLFVVTEPNAEIGTAASLPSPLSPAHHVTPTLTSALEDACVVDDNIDAIVVPDPVTSRRGSGI